MSYQIYWKHNAGDPDEYQVWEFNGVTRLGDEWMAVGPVFTDRTLAYQCMVVLRALYGAEAGMVFNLLMERLNGNQV